MEAVTLAEINSFDPQPVRAGARMRYLCPLSPMCSAKPRDNAHRSLAVDDATGVFYCHRCGEKGRLREFWERRENAKQLIHLKLRQRTVPVPVSRQPAVEKKPDNGSLSVRMKMFSRAFKNSAAQNYLQARQIPLKTILKARCGSAAAWEHWEKNNGDWKLSGTDERVVFPVFNEKEKLVAFHARAINEHYLNSPKITKGNKSLGVFLSSPEVFDSPVVAICEGPVDALALETCGIPAVAMIGTSAPKWLAARLAGKAVLIATDADKAGDEAAIKLEVELRPHTKTIYRLRPQHSKDWAEELETLGAEKKREEFTPFARDTDDVTRANASWQCVLDGDLKAAEFVARLINDVELCKALLVLVHKEYLMAA